jgi:asparagine synthase (glutamine-hydrolysing)
MCGIAGYWGEGNKEILDRMIDSISYRGPDDRGVFVKNNIGLGQRRLSIIDLSPTGHQPMFNETKDIAIVFNGEIYNFLDLKSKIKNHKFFGTSDTEVILRLYEDMGEMAFEELEGMFAIAILDLKKGKLFLSRDHMGKKPLYWFKNKNTFIFGSELKALMNHPQFKKEIDLDSLNKYLSFEYIPTPHSIFKDTKKVLPGSYLSWDGEKIKEVIFWRPTFIPKNTSFKDSLDLLNKKIAEATKKRLVADVPVGVFLSGGLDSSTIAYYAQQSSTKKIKTFSIGFKEQSFDESIYARKVAEFLGTDHYEKFLSIEESKNIILKIGNLLDEPIADASIVPTYLLSEFTRKNVTVALGGDGADELFCGYDTFIAHRISSIYSLVPKFIRNSVIMPLTNAIPTSYSNISFDFKLKKFINGFEGNTNYRDLRWMGAFNKKEKSNLFHTKLADSMMKKNEYDDIDQYLKYSDSNDYFDNLTLLYERMYMMDQVLVKVDRASMMNSLEVRAPFLDKNVVELVNHFPIQFKFKGLERKFILKKLMEDKLPREIIYRKKKGFGMPIGEWIKGDMKPLIEEYLSKENINKMSLFDYSYIRKILDEHYTGKKDNRKQIWTLFVFAMWWKKWMI